MDADQIIKFFNLSEEQAFCVRLLLTGQYHIVCQAIAGSGKSLVLNVAAIILATYHLDLHILILTYNKELKEKNREQLRRMCHQLDPTNRYDLLKRIASHNFHAAALAYFITKADFETKLKSEWGQLCIASCRVCPRDFSWLGKVGVLMVDEVQDMNQQFWEFTLHVMGFCRPGLRLLLCGDYFQRINSHNGSKTVYMEDPAAWFDRAIPGAKAVCPGSLTHKEILEKHVKRPWKTCGLSISFRVPHAVTLLINDVLNPMNLKYASGITASEFNGKKAIWQSLWGQHGIRANPTREDKGITKQLWWCGSSSDKERTLSYLEKFIKDHEKESSEIVFLASSWDQKKSSRRSPISVMMEQLRHRLKDFVFLTGDVTGLDDVGNAIDMGTKALLPPKHILCRTIGKVKGKEWKYVITLDVFSHYWENYYAYKLNPLENTLETFNKMYVAATRAQNTLIVVHTSLELSRMFATWRKTKLNLARDMRVQTEVEVRSLLIHVPFHTFLSNPDLIVQSTIHVTTKSIPITPFLCHAEHEHHKMTLENVTELYESALLLALQIYLWIVRKSVKAAEQDKEFEFLTSTTPKTDSSSSSSSCSSYSSSYSSLKMGKDEPFRFQFPCLERVKSLAMDKTSSSSTTWGEILNCLQSALKLGNGWAENLFRRNFTESVVRRRPLVPVAPSKTPAVPSASATEVDKDGKADLPRRVRDICEIEQQDLRRIFPLLQTYTSSASSVSSSSSISSSSGSPQYINPNIWPLLVEVANASFCGDTGYSGKWSTVDKNYNRWVPQKFLTHCFNNMMQQIWKIVSEFKETKDIKQNKNQNQNPTELELLNQIKTRPILSVRFQLPWTQLNTMYGIPDLIIHGTPVQIRLRNSIDNTLALESQLHSVVQSVEIAQNLKVAPHPKTNARSVRSFLLLPNVGVTYCLNWNKLSLFPCATPKTEESSKESVGSEAIETPKTLEPVKPSDDEEQDKELEQGDDQDEDLDEMDWEEFGDQIEEASLDTSPKFSIVQPSALTCLSTSLGDVTHIFLEALRRKSDTLCLMDDDNKGKTSKRDPKQPTLNFLLKPKSNLPRQLLPLLAKPPKAMEEENKWQLFLENFAALFHLTKPKS